MEIGHNRGIRNLHVNHNAPYSTPQILHNLCFSILLGITVVPREIENHAYAKFWGVNKVHYGICASKWCIGYAKLWGGGGASKLHYGKCGSGVWLIMAPD